MARVTTVITSINSNTSESPNVVSTVWSTDSGTITLSSDLSASIKVGDVIADFASNSYLITGISGAVLTCQDFDSTTDPITGDATIGEAYSTITLWEADLDAGTNAEVYKSGDDAQGEGYNNGTHDEAVTINGGGSIGLNSILLTVPESERHDGTEGSGTRIVRTGSLAFQITPGASRPITIEWWEIDANGQAFSQCFNNSGSAGTTMNLFRLIYHGKAGNTAAPGYLYAGGNRNQDVLDCIVYDIFQGAGGSQGSIGIEVETGGTQNVMNCAVHDIVNNGGTGLCIGINIPDAAGRTVQNCIATDPSGSTSGLIACYDPASFSNATVDHNLASDTTASGTGSLDSKTSANQFVSNSAPYDLHIKIGADAFEAPAADLGTTPAGINIDIDGYDRDAGGTTWSMGAHDGNNLRGVGGGILVHPGMSGGMQELTGGMRG